jgi:uncharacterized protein involved in exopolysaccharide biosynthesis
MVGAGIWQQTTSKDYRAVVLLSSASSDSSNMGSLSAAMGQLGSIGSLVGLTGFGAGAQRPEPLAILQSRALSTKFIADNNLLPVLFYSRWDATHATWKPSFFRHDPTMADAYKKFNDLRRVSQDTKTTLISVTVTWRDPSVAANWANHLVRMANEFIRQRSLAEAQRNISYLTDQLSKTNLVEIRSALGSLIENQAKQQMLAEGTEEFAFKVIDPAVAPDEPSSPGFLLSIICGALAGGLLFSFGVLAKLLFASAG